MTALEVRSLSRVHGGQLALDEVSFSVDSGRIAAVLGSMLSGKTTLLRVIAGVERADGGDVLFDGAIILRHAPERRHTGLMYADLALFEQLTARENVEYGLRMRGTRRAERLSRAMEWLDAVGLHEQAGRPVGALTPSERQRIAFARTIAAEPSLLLLDEPTALVNEVERDDWRLVLRQILSDLGTTTLIATDELRDATMLADDLVLLQAGGLLQSGPIARVTQGPASIEAAAMVGYVPLIRGAAADGQVIEPGVGAVAIPEGFPLRHTAVAMAHPASLFGVPGGSGLGNGVNGTVRRARPDGPVWTLELSIGNRVVTVRWEWDLVPPEPGAPIEVAARPGTLRFFNDTPTAPRMPTPTPSPARATFTEMPPDADSEGDGGETGSGKAPGDDVPAAAPTAAGRRWFGLGRRRSAPSESLPDDSDAIDTTEERTGSPEGPGEMPPAEATPIGAAPTPTPTSVAPPTPASRRGTPPPTTASTVAPRPPRPIPPLPAPPGTPAAPASPPPRDP